MEFHIIILSIFAFALHTSNGRHVAKTNEMQVTNTHQFVEDYRIISTAYKKQLQQASHDLDKAIAADIFKRAAGGTPCKEIYDCRVICYNGCRKLCFLKSKECKPLFKETK